AVEEIGNGAAEEVGFGDEVGIENGDKFAAGSFKAVFKGAGFVAFAVGAVNISDGHACRGVAIDAGFGDFTSFVGGIVEDLHVEEFMWIIETGDGFDEALDDVTLIEDGELDGDARPLVDWRWRAGDVFAVLVVVVDE